jgi:hypothetical protein
LKCADSNGGKSLKLHVHPWCTLVIEEFFTGGTVTLDSLIFLGKQKRNLQVTLGSAEVLRSSFLFGRNGSLI